MKERYPKRTIGMFVSAVLLFIVSASLSHNVAAGQTNQSTEQIKQTIPKKATIPTKKNAITKKERSGTSKSSEDSSSTEVAVTDWRHPSEKKAYPVLQEGDWVDVSLANQRVKIMRKNRVLYTMVCSTGSGGDRRTPTGTYSIQAERGETFFNESSGEGANYWVSWKDHGVYLFHSVPIDASGDYIEEEAEELGQKANSHGCIRLTVADAKWFYEHALYGMQVIVH